MRERLTGSKEEGGAPASRRSARMERAAERNLGKGARARERERHGMPSRLTLTSEPASICKTTSLRAAKRCDCSKQC